MVNHFYQRTCAGQHQQRSDKKPGIGDAQSTECAGFDNANIHHDESGKTAGRIHHHEKKNHAQIKQPGFGQFRQQHKRQHHENAAQNWAKKESGSAEERKQQISAGARRAYHFGRDDFKIQGAESTGNACKKSCNDESPVAHLLGVVTNELYALRVVTHCIKNAAQRGLCQRVQQGHRHKGVSRNQVVHLALRAIVDAQEDFTGHPVAGHPGLAAKELGKHQRHGEYQLCHA